MQRTPISWLPPGALDRSAIDGGLADMARQWSSKWFARSTVRPLDVVAPMATLAGEAQWLVLDNDLAIAVQPGARVALARLMLGATAGAEAATDGDARIVTDLSSACLDDLCRRVAQVFRLPAEARWTPLDGDGVPEIGQPRGCGLGVDSRALLRIVASTELMIALVKAGLPPTPRTAMLPPLAAGLAAQEVSLSALLGRCALTLADFADLSEGDVLVFDTALDAPLGLMLGGGAAPAGRCTVERSGDRLDLHLLDSLNR